MMRRLTCALAVMMSACTPQYFPAGPVTVEPDLQTDVVVVRDGMRLPLSRWMSPVDPAGVIIALHSFGDFRLAFDDIGPELANRGYHVLAYDQRGFGDSQNSGHWSGAQTMIEDLQDMVAVTSAKFPELPLYVMGESMGGGVALAAAGSKTGLGAVSGLILAAPAVRENVTFRYVYNLFLWSAAHVAPSATIYNDRGGSKYSPIAQQRLSSDSRIVRDVRIDTYWGLIRLTDMASDRAPDVRLPVLLMHSDDDQVVMRKSIGALAGHLGDRVMVKYWDDAPHELLHWREQASVITVIADWLNR